MRKDSLIVWVYLIIQKGQHGTQPPPPQQHAGLVVSHIHSGVLLSGGQRWEEQRGAGDLMGLCEDVRSSHSQVLFLRTTLSQLSREEE